MAEEIKIKPFRSGYINIIGKPNAGKSTLVNAIIGEKIAITSHKVQTTRHRILGIITTPEFQAIFSDTPGIILKPMNLLHENMMTHVKSATEDADVMIYLLDAADKWDNKEGEVPPLLEKLSKTKTPLFLVLNKIDLLTQEEVEVLMEKWSYLVPIERIIPMSALKKFNLEKLFNSCVELLPEGVPYFPEEQYTDKSERFLASETIREKIFMYYKKEIPYAAEVVIASFKEEETIIRIAAEIFVERQSQKGIMIGNKGEALKKVGTAARKELEEIYAKKVFLEMFVKVREDWRDKPIYLKQLGHENK